MNKAPVIVFIPRFTKPDTWPDTLLFILVGLMLALPVLLIRGVMWIPHLTRRLTVAILLLSGSCFCYAAPITNSAGVTLSNFVVQARADGVTDSVNIRNWLLTPTNTGQFITTTNIISRDDLTVKLETVVKSIAQTYGISITNNLAEVRQIFVSKYATNTGTTAASIASRDQILDDKATFQTAYGILRTLNVTAAATQTNIVTSPVFSNSRWLTNSAPITVPDIEAAQ